VKNPSDAIRETILRYLYELQQKARSLKGASTNIRDLKRAMKQESISQQEVIANLDYLIQKGWVKPETERKTFTTKSGISVPSTSTRYKITDVGIDKIEGESAFQRRDRYAGINITNIQGVTVIGDENVVNAEYSDLYQALNELEGSVSSSEKLSDEEKLNVTADIESLKNQLSKPKPDKTIISKLWSGIDKAVKVAGLVQAVAQVATLVQPFIG
jgi:hypothetical protein